MFLIDTKFLLKFVLTGLTILALAAIGIYGSNKVFVQSVNLAQATGQTQSYPPRSKIPCQPGKQVVMPHQKINFKTDNPQAVWKAPGGSLGNGRGNNFETSYDNPGNYRVWSDDSETSCFVHVVDPEQIDVAQPEPALYPVYRVPQHLLTEYQPAKKVNHYPKYKTAEVMEQYEKHQTKPKYQHREEVTKTKCPSGWNQQTYGVATVCVPENQPQPSTPNKNQSQNQTQNNNQTQNVNQNVVVNGGNSSSSSSSSSSNSNSIEIIFP